MGSGHLSSFDRALEHEQSPLAGKAVDVIRRADHGSLWAVGDEANERLVYAGEPPS